MVNHRYWLHGAGLAVLAATLLSCATSEPTRYHKPGATEADFAVAREVCTAYVRQAFNPYEDYGSPVFRSPRSERLLNERLEQERLFDECMSQRGWQAQRPQQHP